MTDIFIDTQFNGPPDSGNGGYCCGLFAAALKLDQGTAAEVMLRSPPPLNQPLQVTHVGQGIEISFAETPVAIARAAELTMDIPSAPTLKTAKACSKTYSGFHQHPFPHCFVCGPARAEGDGLCIFPGPLADHSQVCAPWRPFAALADDRGMVRPEFIWSALDCPSYFGAFVGQSNAKAVLGKQCLKILAPQIPADTDYIITAWPIGQDGRKYYGGTALFNQAGTCLALARGTWIIIE